jgi:hypothetical protein
MINNNAPSKNYVDAQNAASANEQGKDRSALLTMLNTSTEYEMVAKTYESTESNFAGNVFKG